MIRLIVNADDLGAGYETDRGIFQSFRDGIVTSASILATGPSCLNAAQEALSCALPIGVHLNLSEGRPLTGKIKGITGCTGEFPGKYSLRKILSAGSFDRHDVLRELTAQVQRILDAGLLPDHLDTHQHFHLFPAATEIVLEVSVLMGIRSIRLPNPTEPSEEDPQGALGQDISLYRALAPSLKQAAEAAGLCTPDGLIGMPLLDHLDLETMIRYLHILPPGCWEMMVHPGYYPDPLNPFSSPFRYLEMEALISPRLRTILRSRHIELITFGDLVCAS